MLIVLALPFTVSLPIKSGRMELSMNIHPARMDTSITKPLIKSADHFEYSSFILPMKYVGIDPKIGRRKIMLNKPGWLIAAIGFNLNQYFL